MFQDEHDRSSAPEPALSLEEHLVTVADIPHLEMSKAETAIEQASYDLSVRPWVPDQGKECTNMYSILPAAKTVKINLIKMSISPRPAKVTRILLRDHRTQHAIRPRKAHGCLGRGRLIRFWRTLPWAVLLRNCFCACSLVCIFIRSTRFCLRLW